MYICVYISVYVNMHICIYIYICACTHTKSQPHLFLKTCIPRIRLSLAEEDQLIYNKLFINI